MFRSSRGFTLVELMVVMGVIAILAGVVLVSLQGFSAKGRTAKALSLMSSSVSGMISCWGNAKESKSPVSGGYICKVPGGVDLVNYGTWPVISSDLSTRGYAYGTGTAENVGGKVGMQSNWYFSMYSSDTNDDVKICCNSMMKGCGLLDGYTSACDASTTW